MASSSRAPCCPSCVKGWASCRRDFGSGKWGCCYATGCELLQAGMVLVAWHSLLRSLQKFSQDLGHNYEASGLLNDRNIAICRGLYGMITNQENPNVGIHLPKSFDRFSQGSVRRLDI